MNATIQTIESHILLDLMANEPHFVASELDDLELIMTCRFVNGLECNRIERETLLDLMAGV